MERRVHDVAIIGGGPAGATAALILARAGLDVLVIDRDRFPRFRIGESFLPRTRRLLRDLGLLDRLEALPHTRKPGIEIGFGDGRRPLTRIAFADVLGDGDREAFNVARAPFDQMLIKAAVEAGAALHEGVAIEAIERLEDGDVRLATGIGPVHARWLFDCSGQATVVGRHLGTRRLHASLRNVAYFGHYEGVARPDGEFGGAIAVIMCDEGWFWMIPLDATRTSVGAVIAEPASRRIGMSADRRLRWAIDHCPVVAERMANATGPERNGTIADFTYRCAPFAGPGHFLVGDAATFLDPVWSTGVGLGMMGAVEAANAVMRTMHDLRTATREKSRYAAWVQRHTGTFFGLINLFYDHAFREVMLAGHGPLEVHRALITLLAGEVYPRVGADVRWRFALLRSFVAIHRRVGLVARHRPHSLLRSAGIADVPPAMPPEVTA